jgi:spore coat polysaccharide biosynthesis predicted glycosyltransferase SpsG
LAIGAAGGTTWERCCAGLPTLMIVAAENQRGVAAAMENSKAALNLGEATREDFELAMVNAIDRFAHRPDPLRLMSERASALTNGDGASRIAEKMFSMVTRTQALHPRESTP